LRQALFENTCQVIIPDLVLYEFGNALRFNPFFTAEDVTAAIHSLEDMNLTIRTVEPEILASALHLAFQYAVTLYDAYFLALAAEEDLVLVTADYKFYQKVGDVKSVVRLDELLGEEQGTILV
jgi:predicted nucleic acid-binding protein